MRMILAVLAIWVTMAGLAMAQPTRVFNVSTYGAKPDDGVADTTGIQKAIDAAAAEAGATGARATVFFPKGTYEVTTITIDKPNLTLDARDVRFEQGTGSGFNQMVYIKGAVDSGTAQYITIIGLTIDGNYPAVNNSGSGIGFNIRASNTYFQDVKAEYTEDATFVTAYCMNNTFDHCESKQAGRTAYRIRGDNQQILNCKAFNWNAVDATNGNRAILADGQEIDTENILVQNFYGEALESRQGMVAVLIDSGDGDDDGSNTLAMGNSGAATSVHGKASWLIDAGHGFAVGDGFKVQETGITGTGGYDGASTTTGKSHKIIEVDGNTFIRSVDANTFSLYSTAAYAIAGGSTGRYDITDSGTGTFYVKSAGALKKQFTVASTVSDTYTCTAHGFTTGQMARLTVKSESGGDSLPTGLKNVARVTVNTDYNGAGTGGKYWREKRNKNVTFRDVTFAVSSPTAEDSAVMKVNNCHNLVIERMMVTQSPEVSGFAITSLLIGPGNRKVTLNECNLPNGVKQVVTSWLPELEIHNCVIGDNAVYPAYAIDSLQVEHLTVKNTKLRFTAAGLATATAAEDLRFADIDVWDVQDNDFEGFSTSTTSRPRQIAINTAAHMNQSGKLRWFNNSRNASGSYQGLTVTTASSDTCTATNHTLMTGDTCYFTTIGALDGAITANSIYYVRRTGDNSFTIHTTPEGASNNTDRVNITGAGTGSVAGDGTGPHYLHGDHVNCNIANSNPLDRLFMHRDGSGKNFEGVTAPTSTSVLFNAGDIIWNMNPSTQADTDGSEPLAWICTKRGQSTGTPSPGTFRTLINDSQPNIGYFVVTDPAYGALGDDSTNDTTAVQAAVTAAAAYTAANSTATATVVLPKGIFRVAGAVGGGAIEVSGDRITIAGPGTLKLVSGDDADAVLYIKSGADYCSVQDITIDGNNAGSPSGRGDCLYMGGNYGMARNVKCQNSKASSGYDFLIIDDTVHNKLVNCTSTNAGYNAFDNRGDYTTVRDCQAIEFGRHGFNQAGGATIELTIDGLFATSSSTTATGVIIDPGSGNDNYVKQAVLRNVKVNLTGATNTLSVVKFARIHDLLIDGCYFTGTADTSTAKIVEACKKITIRDTYFSDNIDFDELGTGTAVTNSFSSVTSNGGFVQISGTAHGHKPRDVIYIVSSVSGYTGLFEVTSVPDANTFVIDCQWTTNTATGDWYDAQGAVVLERVQIGEPSMTRTSSPLSGLRTPRLTMRNCLFYGCRVRGVAAKNTYPITAIERYDIENCFFEFNRTGDSVTIEVLGGETTETDFFTSSRKVRWVNNSYRNLSTGTVKTFLSTDSQLFTTSLDGGRDYTLTSGSLPSGTAVTWQVGDRFFKPSPAAGASPGWVCTTAGTFSTGTFTVMPELEVIPTIIDDLSDVTITSFSSGETLRYNGSALVDSKLASTDLSDFASTIVGNTGDVIAWNGSAWDDLTMATAITNAFGNGTDNYVLTSDGAGGVAWEAQTGGASAIKTPDGTTSVTRVQTYNPIDYGAGTDYRQSRTSGTTAAGTSVVLEAGEGPIFSTSQYLVIPGAGAAHVWAAVTPTAPTVSNGGHTVFTCNTSTDYLTVRDYQASINTPQQVRMYATTSLPTVGGTPYSDGDTLYLRRATVEIQSVTITNTGGSPGGSFTLTVSGYGTTGAISWNSSTTTMAANIQTGLRAVTGLSNVTCAYTSGSFSSGAVFNVWFFGVPGDVSTMTSADSMTGTTHSIVHGTTSANYAFDNHKYTAHPTSTDATNNTNTVNFDGAGSGTLTLSPIGATTRSYRIVGLADAGGYTVRSSATSTTTGMSTLSVGSYDVVWWDPVSDGGSNYCNGYIVYGGTDDHFLTKLNATPNALKVTMQSGGYTNCAPTDVGKYVVYSGTTRGKLMWYDNSTRVWIVQLDYDNADTFPAAAACTITTPSSQTNGYPNLGYTDSTTGEGAGTVTGTSTYCYVWQNCGDSDFDYDCPTYVWRTGKEQQVIQVSNCSSSTSGNFELCYGGYQISVAIGASSSTMQTALRTIPGLEGIVVSSSGTSPNLAYTVTFEQNLGSGTEYGLGDVPEIKPYWGAVTGDVPFISVSTTVQGACNNLGDQVLSAGTSSGTWQELIETSGYRSGGESTPSFSSTRNTVVNDGKIQLWVRRDGFYPVTSPSAQAANAYFGQITAISTDTLTVTPSTTTSVADDTPVFRNDLPAFQAAFNAANAAKGGGVIEAPAGYYSWFTRTDGYSEWTELPTGGNDSVGLFKLSSLSKKIGFNLNGGYVFWRMLEVSAGVDDDPTTYDDSDSMHVFCATQGTNFFWNNATFAVVPVGEPLGETPVGEHNVRFMVSSSINNDGDNTANHHYENDTFYIPAFGSTNGANNPSIFASNYSANCHYIYGGSGHDACLGDGEYHNCKIEGALTRWCSTGFYSDADQNHPVRLTNCDFINIGVDGLRIRNPNFEMIGGSIQETRDNHQVTTAIVNLRGPAFGDAGNGARLSKVFINAYKTGVLCDSPNSLIEGCNLRNCGIAISSSSASSAVTGIRVVGNNIVANGWIRQGASQGGGFISLDAYSQNCLVYGNTVTSEGTTSDSTLGGITECSGIAMSSANSTNNTISANIVRAGKYGLIISTSFVGNASVIGNSFYTSNIGNATGNISSLLQPGNGASITYRSNTWDALTKADAVTFQGTSSASHDTVGDVYKCEMEVAAALTGVNSWKQCKFADSTTSVDFLDAGTIIVENDFAVEPTLTGATLFTSGNSVAGVKTKSVSLTGSQNNYAWPTICDTVLFDANGSYSITGIVPRAKGSVITAVNVDASDNLTFSHASGSSTAGNQLNITAGSDLVDGPADGTKFIATGGATLGWSQN